MMFSRRTQWSKESNALNRLLEEKLASGAIVLNLTETNPTRCGFRFLKPGLLASLSRPENLKYEPDPHGLMEAQLAVCGYYRSKGIKLRPEQVFITAGSSESYSFIWRLLCDPGDGILAPSPSYPLLDYLAALNDVTLLKYPLSRKDAWRADPDSLGRLFGQKPKGIVLVNPNNPTGSFLCEEEIMAINRHCAEEGTAIISDEVFIDFKWRGSQIFERSLAGNTETLTFTLNGVSKMLGLPQMKLSWIVVSGPPLLVQDAIHRLEVIADTFLSAATPSQRALGAWMARRETIREEIVERLSLNLETLRRAALAGGAFKMLPAEGGWHAVIQVNSAGDDEKLALGLLRNHGVFAHPGYFYDIEEPGSLVLSLLGKADFFKEGVRFLSG